MKPRATRCVFTIVGAFAISAMAASQHRGDQAVIRVTCKPTGILYSALPTIKVYPDGRVWIQRSDGSTLTKRIDTVTLSGLLQKLDKLGFYSITSSSVKASMRQPPKITKTPDGRVEVSTEALVITDLATSTISVRRDGRIHTVSCYGVEEFAEHYPRAADLNILKNTIAAVYSAVGES
jgi:hypothetical protein